MIRLMIRLWYSGTELHHTVSCGAYPGDREGTPDV
jgi:hypothetical protein